MIDKHTYKNIFCETEEEQNMILDIFEMLDMRWRAGETPRGYTCRNRIPMYFCLDGDGTYGEAKSTVKKTINASDLRNQWISLKIKTGRR